MRLQVPAESDWEVGFECLVSKVDQNAVLADESERFTVPNTSVIDQEEEESEYQSADAGHCEYVTERPQVLVQRNQAAVHLTSTKAKGQCTGHCCPH